MMASCARGRIAIDDVFLLGVAATYAGNNQFGGVIQTSLTF